MGLYIGEVKYKIFIILKLILDIDGVLVTTPAWKQPEFLPDGFMKFNTKAAQNLAYLVERFNPSIILSTTHRINYSLAEWQEIFKIRGIYPVAISKINNLVAIREMESRATEILKWIESEVKQEAYIIIDDDLSLHDLPSEIKNKCVLTKPLIGLDAEATQKAIDIFLTIYSEAKEA